MSLADVQIRPQKVFFGKNQVQIQTIKCVADVAESLENKYFLFHDASGAKRYAWFQVGGSGGVDPAPAGGWTGHQVNILANDSATAVATALAAVLTAVSGFDATSSAAIVTLTATDNGYAQPVNDSTVPTGFAFKVTQLGSVEREIGCISGDLELSGFEVTKTDVTCHDTGTTVKKQIVSGYSNPELPIVLQETNKEALKKSLIDAGMVSFTKIGADQNEIFGWGPQNVGGDNPKIYVRLHAAEVDASDKTDDINLWTCEVQIESLLLSGENVSTMPISLTVFPDESKPKAIQFLMIGDAVAAGY